MFFPLSEIWFTSTHSTLLRGLVKAALRTSSTFLTGTISIFSSIVLGTSIKSFLFSIGIKTFLIPALCAAKSFSFNPPIGRTNHLKVISTVIATSLLTGISVIAEIIEVTIPIPAEGPSFGVAPSGT